MTYNPEKQIYEFHSQVAVPTAATTEVQSGQKPRTSKFKRKDTRQEKEQVRIRNDYIYLKYKMVNKTQNN